MGASGKSGTVEVCKLEEFGMGVTVLVGMESPEESGMP